MQPEEQPRPPPPPPPKPTTTTKSIHERERETTTHIRHLCDIWLHQLNAHVQDAGTPLGEELLLHVSPDFKAKVDGYREFLSWTGLREAWLKDARKFPEAKLEMDKFWAYVNEDKGNATVYQEMTSNTFKVRMRTFSEVKWVRMPKEEGEQWMIVKFTVMRGSEEIFGFV